MTKRFKAFSIYSLVVLVLLSILYYQGRNIFTTLYNTKLHLLPWLILLNIPYIALGGLAFDKLCQPYKIQLRWQDWFGLSFIANFINQLLPYRPGMAIRYFYLSQHYKMKLATFTLIMIVYFVLMIILGTLFCTIGFFLPHLPQEYYAILKSLFWAGLSGIFFIFLIKCISSLAHYFPFLVKITRHITHAIQLYLHQPQALATATFCLLGMHLVAAFLIYISFSALTIPIPILHCLFLTGLMSIAMLFPVTPGNIGILETVIGSFTQMMYGNFSIGFSAVALFRASQWLPSLILGSYFGIKLMGRIIPRISSSISLGDNIRLD